VGIREADAVADGAALVHRWFAAWNRADPEALRELLHLPHVGLQGSRLLIRESERAIREQPELRTVFPALIGREGWHHTTLDAVTTRQPQEDKVHHFVTFGRFTVNGSRYADGEAVYVALRRGGRWGIQLSSGTLRPIGVAAADDERAVAAAAAVVRAWIAAHERRDWDAVADLAHRPRVEIRRTLLRVLHERGELLAHAEEVRRGWARCGIVRMAALQRSAQKVAFEVDVGGRSRSGASLPPDAALYIVTERDGRWGMQASSVLWAP
jgi:hypothetical protein